MEDETKKKYNLFANILYVYKGVMAHKPYLALILFFSVISSIGARYIWLFVSKMVIGYIDAGVKPDGFIKQISMFSILAVIFMIMQVLVMFWVDPAAFYVRPMFMLKRNRSFFHLGYERTEEKDTLDSRQKSINATSWTQNGVEGLIRKTIVFFSELAICITACVILGKSSPIMIGVVVIFGTISYFMVDKTSALEKKYTKDDIVYEKRKEEHFTKSARDFTYGKDIRIFKMENALLSTINSLNSSMHKNVCKARNAWIRCDILVCSMDMGRELIMYIILIYMIITKKCSIAEFTLYIGCVRNFALAYQTLSMTFAEMRNCSREVNDFRAFETLCNNDKSEGKNLPSIDSYCFEFKNVSFKYPSSDNYALKNLNIKIENGMKLAVVGLNGAGKTTFIKLLLRLYEPTEGEILLNGVNIQEYSREEYFRIFAPVFQDLECFAFTLAENISMTDLDRTDLNRAEKIAKKVGLEDKLKGWKSGILTNIQKELHEDGIILSGGEAQKMGLARALYKGAPVAILDEPTAALDVMAESKMYEDFNEMVKGQTSVYISHRLASTKFCDKIAMFQDGRMIEFGSHDDLMTKHGKYYEMFEMQAYYYKDNVEKG